MPGLAENLRLQDEAGRRLKNYRFQQGALNLQTIEARPVFDGDRLNSLEVVKKNRTREMIENFMIAANGVTARFLAGKHYPAIRRVVLAPKRWDRIVEIAAEHGAKLPVEAEYESPRRFSDPRPGRRPAALSGKRSGRRPGRGSENLRGL